MERLNEENAKALDELLKKMITQDGVTLSVNERLDRISEAYTLAQMLEADGYAEQARQTDVFQYQYCATPAGKSFYLHGGYARSLTDKSDEAAHRKSGTDAANATAGMAKFTKRATRITIGIAMLTLLVLIMQTIHLWCR
jgi:hypothetical protein